jgi:hypothetical protein
MHSSGTSIIPQEELKNLILKNFPELKVENFGWHKIVFSVPSIDHKIVLKVGARKSIENDHRAYKRVPESMRHQLFARIFWHTKYCLLQEHGLPAHVTLEQLTRLRQDVYRYGIFDIKEANLKQVDGQLKIIDANVTKIPIPLVLRKIDEVKPKLPKRLMLFSKKIARMLYDK